MKPISKMRQLTTEVAEGNLSNRIMITSEDEISRISEQFNDLIDTIENILKRMKDTSSELFSRGTGTLRVFPGDNRDIEPAGRCR